MKNTESVLDLFHGLSEQQARELRARMLPALFELREEIVKTSAPDALPREALKRPGSAQQEEMPEAFPRKRKAARLELEKSAGERS